MPLEEQVESLEGIDEQYHDLYVKKDDGKFEIDVGGLKSALTKERQARKKLEKLANSKNEDQPDVEELKGQLKEAQNAITGMKLKSVLKNTALKAGVDADYVDDVITLTREKFKLDDDGTVLIVDADGEPTGKTVDNFFKEDFKKAKPRFYTNDNKSGSGMQQNLNGGGPLSYEAQLRKAKEEGNRLEIIRLKNKKYYKQ